MNDEGEGTLPYSRIPINKNRKSPLATTTVTTASSKTHQWILKLVSERLLENRIIILSLNTSAPDFINYKGENPNFKWRNLTDTTTLIK